MKLSCALAVTALCALAGVSEGTVQQVVSALHWKFTVGNYVLIVRYCVVFVTGRRGFGPGEQEFGYVHVRPGAHMFYWLYYTTAPRDWSETPLVMWLQGGPGASSTSHGNFETIGPLTTDLGRRNSSWVGALKSEKRTYG